MPLSAAECRWLQVLSVFPYESSRKRMSVIVKLSPILLGAVGGTDEIRLYTKGADSVLLIASDCF